jgi:hypothetical protein
MEILCLLKVKQYCPSPINPIPNLESQSSEIGKFVGL